jgi:hypothetical protein
VIKYLVIILFLSLHVYADDSYKINFIKNNHYLLNCERENPIDKLYDEFSLGIARITFFLYKNSDNEGFSLQFRAPSNSMSFQGLIENDFLILELSEYEIDLIDNPRSWKINLKNGDSFFSYKKKDYKYNCALLEVQD